MSERNFSARMLTGVLVILATALAGVGMVVVFDVVSTNYFIHVYPEPLHYQYTYGYQLYTAWVSLGLQLLVSCILIFVVAKQWLRSTLIVFTSIKFLVVLVFLEIESAFHRQFPGNIERIGWGYWMLLMASVILVVACIVKFFEPKPLLRDPRTIDNMKF